MIYDESFKFRYITTKFLKYILPREIEDLKIFMNVYPQIIQIYSYIRTENLVN